MKNLVWLFLIFVLALALVSAPQSITQASQVGAYLYTRTTPSVIYADDQDRTTIEVFTTNQNVSGVSLKSYHYEDWQMLFDDGSHGDRNAGDGVFTLSEVTTEMLPPYSMEFFQGKAGSAYIDIQVTYSNGQPPDEGYTHINVVAPGIVYPFQPVASNRVASEYALFVTDPDGKIFHGEPYPAVDREIDLSAATRMFYDLYPDDFDFLVVMPIHRNFRPSYEYSEGPVPFATTVRAAADNIGVDDYYIDDTIDYGCEERLLTVIYHTAGYGKMLTHEIGHTWSAYIGDQQGLQDKMTAHWNANSDLGGIMGSFVTPYADDPETEMDRMGVGLPVNFNIRSNPDGSFKLVDAHGYKEFIPLDLYLMGLIPPEDIPPVHILDNPDFSDPEHVTAQEIKTYTYTDMLDMAGGRRDPAYPDARREFNIGFIFFSDRKFSDAEIAWGSMVAREVTLQESDSINTFYRATGGRATLNARLADWGIPDLSALAVSAPTQTDTPSPTSQMPTQSSTSLESDQEISSEPGKPVWNENLPCVSSLTIVPFILLGFVHWCNHKKKEFER